MVEFVNYSQDDTQENHLIQWIPQQVSAKRYWVLFLFLTSAQNKKISGSGLDFFDTEDTEASFKSIELWIVTHNLCFLFVGNSSIVKLSSIDVTNSKFPPFFVYRGKRSTTKMAAVDKIPTTCGEFFRT